MKPTQAKILKSFTEHWKKYPGERFFQAISSWLDIGYLFIEGKPTNVDTFHISDEQVIEWAKKQKLKQTWNERDSEW